ncbi:MAG: hypothetical protein AABX12_01105 [Nanoarchaeota archaeon]
MTNQPALKYVHAPTKTKGVLFVGASNAFHMFGSDIYVWNGRDQPKFVGVHTSSIKHDRDTDGLARLAELVTKAYREGYLVSYDLPSQASASGKGRYRELDFKEMTTLRNRLGLPPLSLAA